MTEKIWEQLLADEGAFAVAAYRDLHALPDKAMRFDEGLRNRNCAGAACACC